MYINSPHCEGHPSNRIQESEVSVFRPEPFACVFVPSCSSPFLSLCLPSSQPRSVQRDATYRLKWKEYGSCSFSLKLSLHYLASGYINCNACVSIGMNKDDRNVPNIATDSGCLTNVALPTTPRCRSVVSTKIPAPRQTGLRTESCESCAVVNVVHPTLQCHPTLSS